MTWRKSTKVTLLKSADPEPTWMYKGGKRGFKRILIHILGEFFLSAFHGASLELSTFYRLFHRNVGLFKMKPTVLYGTKGRKYSSFYEVNYLV